MHACRQTDMQMLKFNNYSLLSWQDLLNFDDPLNSTAAEHYQRDKVKSSALGIYTIAVMAFSRYRSPLPAKSSNMSASMLADSSTPP